jgi:fructose-1,6-bisphosphatase/inositol monophosphatase family enzyme
MRQHASVPADMNETLRDLLCHLGDTIRDRVLAARNTGVTEDLASVAAVTAADTIYRVDKISEAVIREWFGQHWPATLPVEVVMEGLEGHGPLTYPEGTAFSQTAWKCILDPIDGTRNLMYDKRSAWALAAVAPQRGDATNLSDIVVATATELPTSKHARGDQVSAVRGAGAAGVRAVGIDLASGRRTRLAVRPSQATDFRHGFASISKFFPEGRGLTARIEEVLWDRIVGLGRTASPQVFDDQYMTSGGQIYELLVGHDRMVADLRPLVLPKLGLGHALCCHPYDVCNALVLEEAGGVVETPEGRPLTAPLDTTSPVAWVGYANHTLAAQMRPVLLDVLRSFRLI